MKVAVCVSGIVREHPERCLAALEHSFKGYDFFFGTWESEQKNLGYLKDHIKTTFVFPNPQNLYNRIQDPKSSLMGYENDRAIESKREQIWRPTKELNPGALRQFIIHSLLLNELPDDYDMIVRTRFDILTSPKVNFKPLIDRSYLLNKAIGIASIFHHDRKKPIDRLGMLIRETPYPAREDKLQLPYFLYDYLIFHPRSLFSITLLNQLLESQTLQFNEEGWFQLLSGPFGNTHECYHGGTQLARFQT